MSNDRDLVDSWLQVFRNLYDSRQAWITLQNAREQIRKNLFDLAVDEVIDFEFIETISFLELPRTRTTDNDLRLVLQNGGMRYDFYELVCVYRHQVFAGEL
jgi:hypothetical protein